MSKSKLIILAGLDRTGKSTVADFYKKKGYEIVHMPKPDKKFYEPGYSGPSYLDEIVELLMTYISSNKNVLFDRSWWGELVWPKVYNRTPLLNETDLMVLKDIEEKHADTLKILMWDPNPEAHWTRCIRDKETITKPQFILARKLYEEFNTKHGFQKMTLSEFCKVNKLDFNKITTVKQNNIDIEKKEDNILYTTNIEELQVKNDDVYNSESEIDKLNLANAINDVISKRIIKQKGIIYDRLENNIQNFLKSQLAAIFGNTKNNNFTDEEILILKQLCKQFLDRKIKS